MNCPIDNEKLITEKFRGIEQDRCPKCSGVWLDYPELDQLENQVLPDEHMKGTMIFSSEQTDLKCPKCGEDMQRFDYRLNNLYLEVCPKLHGFWLDAGEEQRVLKLMGERIKGLQKAQSADAEWKKELNYLRSPNVINWLKKQL